MVGEQHAADADAQQAQFDAAVAYDFLKAQGVPVTACDFQYVVPTDIGGVTLTPGIHCFHSSAGITGPLTLDAQGNSSAVWVFNIESTLITAPASSVVIVNGGSACNVFWRVGSSATLDTTTAFQGSIFALEDIDALTGATVVGRLFARTAAVDMQSNTVSIPTNCGVPNTPVPTSTNTPVNTSTPTPTNTPVNTPTPTPTNTPVGNNDICPGGAAENQRTVILGKGMGNDDTHKNLLKLTIPNWQTVDTLYGQLVGEQNGAAKYVRFIYPNNTYKQVNVLTSPAYRQWATFWYGADLNPAASISGRWFLQTSGTNGHIPRAFLLFPTYHTTEQYVNVFDPLAFDESNKNHVYYNVSAGWIPAQQYRMAIPAPLQAVTIVVQVALIENDKDNRPLRLTVSAAGATPQTVSPTGPSHGDLLNIVTFNLPIQAGTEEIVIDLVSPNPNGDSGAMVAAAAYYACVPPG